jgi:3'-5' exoribonuclease
MKQAFARGLVEGDSVDSEFALRYRELRTARGGDAYLSMDLSDRSGSVPGVLFRPSVHEQAIPTGSVVRVRGVVTTFRGTTRISVDSMAEVGEYDLRDLMPAGPRDPNELLGFFDYLRGEVSDRRLAAVVAAVFDEPCFMDAFRECPAGQSHHHAYCGGLLEHTVSVAALCEHAAQAYERVDRDLLLAAALLHDVGKVDELVWDTSIGYSDTGRLIGHVVLGERRVSAAMSRLGDLVPVELALRLSHVILSHHGELEWGAPKRPCTLEALVLHHVDNLDAKVAGFLETVSSAAAVEERWTDVRNLFRRPLYVPRAFEDDRPRTVSEDADFVQVRD